MTSTPEYHGYFDEQAERLAEVAAAIPATIAALGKVGLPKPTRLLFVGSGTSRYAAELAAALATSLGVTASAAPSLPALETMRLGGYQSGTLVVAISQSGGTRTLVQLLEAGRERGYATVAVTNYPGSPLAQAADVTVQSHSGDEPLYAKTKGFTTTALAACGVAIAIHAATSPAAATLSALLDATTRLPEAVESAVASAHASTGELAERFRDVGSILAVGSGYQWAAAREGALKLMEVAKLPVASFELEESLHGPFNAVGPETGLVLVIDATADAKRVLSFARAARAVKAPLIVVSSGPVPSELDEVAAVDVTVPACAVSALNPLVAVVPLQLLAWQLAILRGVRPDLTRYPELYAIFQTKEGQG